MNRITRKLYDFLADESGFVRRDEIVKAGILCSGFLSAIAELGYASCSHTSHFNGTVPEHLGKSGCLITKEHPRHINGNYHLSHVNELPTQASCKVSHHNENRLTTHNAHCY